MASLVELWIQDTTLLHGKTVQQVVAVCGDGKLREDNHTSTEFRDLLARIPAEILANYAGNCLEISFQDSGLVLQDVINQIGVRLGFSVIPGRYRWP